MKKLPIEQSDFRNIISENDYYIDKSLLIKEVIDDDTLVMLLSRPRRFGKTMNLSILRYFFEHVDHDQETKRLFRGLAIEQEDVFHTRCNQYPVIFLTFKKEYHTLLIPNREVKQIFEDMILLWITESYENRNLQLILHALINNDIPAFEEILSDFVLSTLSYIRKRGIQQITKLAVTFDGKRVWVRTGEEEKKREGEREMGRRGEVKKSRS